MWNLACPSCDLKEKGKEKKRAEGGKPIMPKLQLPSGLLCGGGWEGRGALYAAIAFHNPSKPKVVPLFSQVLTPEWSLRVNYWVTPIRTKQMPLLSTVWAETLKDWPGQARKTCWTDAFFKCSIFSKGHTAQPSDFSCGRFLGPSSENSGTLPWLQNVFENVIRQDSDVAKAREGHLNIVNYIPPCRFILCSGMSPRMPQVTDMVLRESCLSKAGGPLLPGRWGSLQHDWRSVAVGLNWVCSFVIAPSS